MPVRFLQYVGHLYEQYIVRHDLYVYGKRLLKLPVPRFVVFYNGQEEKPDEMILKLSDSFPEGAVSDIEVKVRMLNINYGKNELLLKACRPLDEYAWFIDKIRQNESAGMSVLDAVNGAIAALPDDFILSPFLRAHRAEVYGMLMQEFDEAKIKKMSWKEGFDEGEKRGEMKSLISLINDGVITVEYASKRSGMEQAEFVRVIEQIKAEGLSEQETEDFDEID